MQYQSPPYLKAKSTIGLVATARKISKEELDYACNLITSQGFQYEFGPNIFEENHQFSGTDAQRAADFQFFLDRKDIHAIFCVRGGYGTVRILDYINWNEFIKNPKWIVGFSDVTILHASIQKMGYYSLHAPMPITFHNNSPSSLINMFACLKGNDIEYTTQKHPKNRFGTSSGILIGGNLSVIYSLLSSPEEPNTQGAILFIEDLDEYIYHIDRMMQNLKRSGLLSKLSGLIVGGMTDMNDNTIPFGSTAEEIIYNVCNTYRYPLLFNFPAGHITNNQPLILGKKIEMNVTNEGGAVKYINDGKA